MPTFIQRVSIECALIFDSGSLLRSTLMKMSEADRKTVVLGQGFFGQPLIHRVVGASYNDSLYEHLRDACQDISLVELFNAQNSKGNSPLHEAVRKCKLIGVKCLLKDGADKTIMNTNGLTPIGLLETCKKCPNLTAIRSAINRHCTPANSEPEKYRFLPPPVYQVDPNAAPFEILDRAPTYDPPSYSSLFYC